MISAVSEEGNRREIPSLSVCVCLCTLRLPVPLFSSFIQYPSICKGRLSRLLGLLLILVHGALVNVAQPIKQVPHQGAFTGIHVTCRGEKRQRRRMKEKEKEAQRVWGALTRQEVAEKRNNKSDKAEKISQRIKEAGAGKKQSCSSRERWTEMGTRMEDGGLGPW